MSRQGAFKDIPAKANLAASPPRNGSPVEVQSMNTEPIGAAVVNAIGQEVVFRGESKTGAMNRTIDITSNASGTYYLKLPYNSSVKYEKFVLNR